MERVDETNIWRNPSEIEIDDNCEPEKNADEIDLSDDDDDCLAPAATETTEKEDKEKVEEDEKEEDSSDDDGAPQSRSFRLPFLPPPKNTDQAEPIVKKGTCSIEVNHFRPHFRADICIFKNMHIDTPVDNKPNEEESKEEMSEEVTVQSTKKGKEFKRRNQAIYSVDDDENN